MNKNADMTNICSRNLNSDSVYDMWLIKELSGRVCEGTVSHLWQQYGKYLLVLSWHYWYPNQTTARVLTLTINWLNREVRGSEFNPCHSDDTEHVPSVPGVHKLLISTCTHTQRNRLSLASLSLNCTCSITRHGIIIFYLCLFLYTQFLRNTTMESTGATCFRYIFCIQFRCVFELSEFLDGCICFSLLKHCECLTSAVLHNSPVFDLSKSSALFFLECILKS